MNPVPLMTLVELIRGQATSSESMAIASALCQRLGKTARRSRGLSRLHCQSRADADDQRGGLLRDGRGRHARGDRHGHEARDESSDGAADARRLHRPRRLRGDPRTCSTTASAIRNIAPALCSGGWSPPVISAGNPAAASTPTDRWATATARRIEPARAGGRRRGWRSRPPAPSPSGGCPRMSIVDRLARTDRTAAAALFRVSSPSGSRRHRARSRSIAGVAARAPRASSRCAPPGCRRTTAREWTTRIRAARLRASPACAAHAGVLMAFLPLALFGAMVWCSQVAARHRPAASDGRCRRPRHHPPAQQRQQHHDFAADGERVRLPEQPGLAEATRDGGERLPRRLQVGAVNGHSAGTPSGGEVSTPIQSRRRASRTRGGRGERRTGSDPDCGAAHNDCSDDQRSAEAVGDAAMDEPKRSRSGAIGQRRRTREFSSRRERRTAKGDEAGAATRRRARPARARPAMACAIITASRGRGRNSATATTGLAFSAYLHPARNRQAKVDYKP